MPKKDDTFIPVVDTLLPPALLSGEEAYDIIMEEIEPDLTSKNIPLLDEKYKRETPLEAKGRAERYKQAFAEYEKRFAQYVAMMQGQVHSYKRISAARAEQKDKGKEADALHAIESSFDSI